MHRLLASFLAIVLFGSQVMSQSLYAQTLKRDPLDNSVPTIRLVQNDPARPNPLENNPGIPSNWPGEIDIDPPVIDHEALETGIPGQTQQFSALVIDDRGLTHVALFHRDRSGAQYSRVEMEQVGSTSEYTVSIETSVDQNSIEYYIEALDTGGNRVLKGFPFFPLVRQLEPLPGTTAEVTETSGPDKRITYVILGVAAVGLAAVLLSGGGGSDDPTVEPPGTVPINITVTPPPVDP